MPFTLGKAHGRESPMQNFWFLDHLEDKIDTALADRDSTQINKVYQYDGYHYLIVALGSLAYASHIRQSHETASHCCLLSAMLRLVNYWSSLRQPSLAIIAYVCVQKHTCLIVYRHPLCLYHVLLKRNCVLVIPLSKSLIVTLIL